MDTNSKQSYFLLLDSATEVCSVALCDEEGIVAGSKTELAPNRHSELLALFADELLKQIPGGAKESLRGVVVSEGPGSYTGLRIGASYAKGLAWALGIPLAAIPTTQALALALLESTEGRKLEVQYPGAVLFPMIDARRMEVYAAAYDASGKLFPTSEIRALVLTDEEDRRFIKEQIGDREVIYFGSGAGKAVSAMEELFGEKAHHCPGIVAGAAAMRQEGLRLIKAGKGVDVGYWTPFYLKEFQATTPKKKY